MPIPLADFLLQHRDSIMEAWEAEVRHVTAAQAQPRPALRDGLPELLEAVARMMRRSSEEVAAGAGAIPEGHALERLGAGFEPRQLVAEYRLLRASVLRLWAAQGGAPARPEEERAFHDALDEVFAAGALARERQARAGSEESLARLRETQAGLRRWEEVFHRLGVGVAIVSAEDGVLRDVNPAFARMHGYSREELLGQPLESTFAPEARGILPRHVSAAHSRQWHEYESLHVRRDGSRFPTFTHVTSFRDESGKVVQRVATVLDITQRRAVEADRQRLLATIEAERARLAAVLDQMPAGVIIAESPSGRVVLSSRQMEALTTCPPRSCCTATRCPSASGGSPPASPAPAPGCSA